MVTKPLLLLKNPNYLRRKRVGTHQLMVGSPFFQAILVFLFIKNGLLNYGIGNGHDDRD
jgi:hypothetical protein